MVMNVLSLTTIDNITAEAAADVVILADQLAALTDSIGHGAVFGNGETLAPGVYDVAEPATIQGTLTLNAEGDSSALFVFRISGALSSVAASEIVLINGADPANVFWRVNGAVSLGASTVFVGTAVAVTGAVSDAAGSSLHGRLLSTEGAISINSEQLITVPETPLLSPIRLGVLSTFVMFSAIGAVSNTGTSTVIGDIGSNQGSITGFVSPTTVDGTIYAAGSSGLTPNTKELRQRRKLELAAINRDTDGNDRATYDVAQLPTKYSDNVVFDNPNTGGLKVGRPWAT